MSLYKKPTTDKKMKEKGFKKSLRYYDVWVNEKKKVLMQEYHAFADEHPCDACRTNRYMWLIIQNGTLTLTCTKCRTTGLLSMQALEERHKPKKAKEITPRKAFEILRAKMKMPIKDIAMKHIELVKLLRDVELPSVPERPAPPE